MRSFFLAASLLCFCRLAAQLSITATNTVFTIDFDNTVAGVNNGPFQGLGLQPSPAGGELDSDAIRFDGEFVSSFGGSYSSSPFAMGSSSGGVSSAGVYAFTVSSGNRALGLQLTNSITHCRVKMTNNTGAIITSMDIGYDIWTRNDEACNNEVDVAMTEEGFLYDSPQTTICSSGAAAAASPSFKRHQRNGRITMLSIDPGETFEFIFAIISECTIVDEVAIDDIKIALNNTSSVTSALSGDYETIEVGPSTAMTDHVTADKFTMIFGRELTIPANKALVINQRLSNDGRLYLANGASIAPGSSGSFTQNLTCYAEVVRNKPAGQANNFYNFWSSPVDAGNTSMMTGAYDIYKFTPGGDETSDYFSYSGFLTPGEGIAAKGVSTATFTGYLNNGTITFPVTFNPSSTLSSNLVGNPYPSAIHAEAFVDDNASILSQGTVYLWSQVNTGTLINTQDFIAVSALGSTAYDRDQLLSSTHIASCQGFFVDVNSSGNITFNSEIRTTANNGFKSGEDLTRFWLQIRGNNRYAATLLGVDPDATIGVDFKYDAKSFSSPDLDINSLIKAAPYCIQGLPAFDPGMVLPLQVKIDSGGAFEVAIARKENMEGIAEVILTDKLLNRSHNLLQGPYHFTEEKKAVYNDRFVLGFSGGTAISDNQRSEVTIRITAQRLLLDNTSDLDKVVIRNMLGQILCESDCRLSCDQLDIPVKVSGMLLVELISGNERVAHRVVSP